MKEKRMIRLINDERTLRSVKKASACDPTSYDGGCGTIDLAKCYNYAADEYCDVDTSACMNGADDMCPGSMDTMSCVGAGGHDGFEE